MIMGIAVLLLTAVVVVLFVATSRCITEICNHERQIKQLSERTEQLLAASDATEWNQDDD